MWLTPNVVQGFSKKTGWLNIHFGATGAFSRVPEPTRVSRWKNGASQFSRQSKRPRHSDFYLSSLDQSSGQRAAPLPLSLFVSHPFSRYLSSWRISFSPTPAVAFSTHTHTHTHSVSLFNGAQHATSKENEHAYAAGTEHVVGRVHLCIQKRREPTLGVSVTRRHLWCASLVSIR